MMKHSATYLLLAVVLLLPAEAFAQQPTNSTNSTAIQSSSKAEEPAHLTKPARRTAIFKLTSSAVKDYCAKHRDHPACKSDATMYTATSKLIAKTPELQAYIETGVAPDRPVRFSSLPIPDKADTDASDKSWMEPGLHYQQHEASPSGQDPSTSVRDALDEAESEISKLEDLSARELGENLVHDIQFPGRSEWEQRLYEKKGRLVAAARAYIAVARDGGNATLLRSAKYDFDLEKVGYNDIVTEGIAKAHEWDRRH